MKLTAPPAELFLATYLFIYVVVYDAGKVKRTALFAYDIFAVFELLSAFQILPLASTEKFIAP